MFSHYSKRHIIISAFQNAPPPLRSTYPGPAAFWSSSEVLFHECLLLPHLGCFLLLNGFSTFAFPGPFDFGKSWKSHSASPISLALTVMFLQSCLCGLVACSSIQCIYCHSFKDPRERAFQNCFRKQPEPWAKSVWRKTEDSEVD